ncbi:MAG: ArsR/SmtB family transcription factor [Opitutaceae bacterium]
MQLIRIHECLCDRTRLRIIHLLTAGPLCVCHFQAVLREPQVKVSKHLAYLKIRGMVVAERRGNWMAYSLPTRPGRQLSVHLACLQDCAAEEPALRRDLERRRRLAPEVAGTSACGGDVPGRG